MPSHQPLRIQKPTVLYVVGADVYIHNDIQYTTATGDTPSLVIIAQKNISGQGGNIYIDPSVTRIDGTLIADGALMNGVLNTSTIQVKNWISNPTELTKRLIINGRLLTYNTRGGSLKTDLTGIQGNNPVTLSALQ